MIPDVMTKNVEDEALEYNPAVMSLLLLYNYIMFQLILSHKNVILNNPMKELYSIAAAIVPTNVT